VALAFVAILSMVAFVASVFGGNLVSMALSLVTTVVSAAIGLYLADKVSR
jgi:hypothetical protein